MTEIKLSEICQEYPSKNGKNVILQNVNLTLQGPSINILMGQSGCGKSTLLRMMGGVRPQGEKTPTSGKVLIDGVECIDEIDEAVTVFQQYSNRPDLTILQNVLFPFTLSFWKKRVSKTDALVRAKEMLDAVGLADKANCYPHQLSGGQNQRVALARALSLRPKILLMDEPFGALDAHTRREMQELLISLFNNNPCVIVLITHDVNEAIVLGDRIIILGNRPANIVYDHGSTDINLTARQLRQNNDTMLESAILKHLKG